MCNKRKYMLHVLASDVNCIILCIGEVLLTAAPEHPVIFIEIGLYLTDIEQQICINK